MVDFENCKGTELEKVIGLVRTRNLGLESKIGIKNFIVTSHASFYLASSLKCSSNPHSPGPATAVLELRV
ncbi:hypothetical protein RRG08_047849 [Elysia crispata]|uniref:Uncharacterized protein n=1 Tax=Elysia crispata TaxID=231223 RepID=A0AAE0ZX93_9GAST|nr:hypothetical protein RRG08_047849 [Elysia crispata]